MGWKTVKKEKETNVQLKSSSKLPGFCQFKLSWAKGLENGENSKFSH